MHVSCDTQIYKSLIIILSTNKNPSLVLEFFTLVKIS